MDGGTGQERISFIKDNSQLLLALGSVYIFICSISYLLGYWGSFNVNVFEFISLYDIIKLSFYNLMYIIIIL